MQISSRSKYERHDELVKEMDVEFKNLSGEGRRTPRSSQQSESPRGSSTGGLSDSPQQSARIQFVREKVI